MSDKPSIGWIGTGVMGAPMAGHLLDAGYPVTVYNRTASRSDALVQAGARRADDPAQLAAQSAIVITMVGYPADVRETVLADGGVLGTMVSGSLLIDMTTSEPTLAAEIHAAAAAREVAALDAPVSGGDLGARNAALVIMAGGDAQAFERARPVFEVLGRSATLQGGPGPVSTPRWSTRSRSPRE